jgi:hypothetical protein
LRRDTLGVAFFAFPFVHSAALISGNYAFAFSMAFFFASLGYWFRVRSTLSLGRGAILATLALLTGFAHVFGAVNLVAAAGVMTVARMLRAARADRVPTLRALGPAIRDHGVGPALAFLPAAVFVVYFIRHHGVSAPTEFAALERLGYLLLALPLAGLSKMDLAFSVPLQVLFATLAFDALRHFRGKPTGSGEGLGLAMVFYVALYLMAPSVTSGTTVLGQRLAPYVFYALILWLAARPIPTRILRLHAMAIGVVALAFVAHRTVQVREVGDYMAEYLTAAPHVEPGSTFLPIDVAPLRRADGTTVTWPVDAFRHAGARLATRSHAVYLRHFQAAHGRLYPVQFRSALNPYRHLSARLERKPPDDLRLDYPAGSGGSVDYVALWGPPESAVDGPGMKPILARLAAAYEPVFTSEPRGLMRLYRRHAEE